MNPGGLIPVNKRLSRNSLVISISKTVRSCHRCGESVQEILNACYWCCPCPVCGHHLLDTNGIRRHIRTTNDDSHRLFDLESWVGFPRTQKRISTKSLIEKIHTAVDPCSRCNETVRKILNDYTIRVDCPVAGCTKDFHNTTNLRQHIRHRAAEGEKSHEAYSQQIASTRCRMCGSNFSHVGVKTRHEQKCMYFLTCDACRS